MPRRTEPLLTLPDKTGVLYVRLYQRMRALILEGNWPAGMRLPSSRTLSADLGVSRTTVVLALDQLLADGWIEARTRSGTYVADAVRTLATPMASGRSWHSTKPPVPFELSPGAVDVFPFDKWAKLQSQVWARFAPDLLYEGDPAGDPGLRQAIAGVVAPAMGLPTTVDELVVTAGSHSAFDLVAATLPRGAKVVVEDPGYLFADDAFARRGLNVVPVRADSDGLDIALARKLVTRPALIVVAAATQFPLGTTMSAERRRDLLGWASESGAWIIDDLFDADAVFAGAPSAVPLACNSGRVVSVASFSRILFRSLRLGFLAAPPELREKLIATRIATDTFVALPDQLVLREFIERGLLSAHQRRCREIYRERRKALVDLLAPYCGTLFDTELNSRGLYLVLRPRHHAAARIAAELRRARIACMTISELSRRETAEDGILLGFAAFSPDVIGAMGPAIRKALDPICRSQSSESVSGGS